MLFTCVVVGLAVDAVVTATEKINPAGAWIVFDDEWSKGDGSLGNCTWKLQHNHEKYSTKM